MPAYNFEFELAKKTSFLFQTAPTKITGEWSSGINGVPKDETANPMKAEEENRSPILNSNLLFQLIW